MASRNAVVLESSIEGIRTEIETFFQNIITCIVERKNLLLRILDESVQQLGTNFLALIDEHSELLSMRDQMEESLNKNQFSDLRIDMLGPLHAKIINQEDKIKSNFKLEFSPTGFEQLVHTIRHFGEVSTKIPVPPLNMPEVNEYLSRRTIPLPPPDYPTHRITGYTLHTARPASAGHRNPNRIPLPPPDIPRTSLFEYTRSLPASNNAKGAHADSYARSTASNSRLRAFFSLLRDKN